jgi:hypothetical protein
MQHVKVPYLWVVLVIMHGHGSSLVDGRGSERGLGVPEVM